MHGAAGLMLRPMRVPVGVGHAAGQVDQGIYCQSVLEAGAARCPGSLGLQTTLHFACDLHPAKSLVLGRQSWNSLGLPHKL